jgi:hypothetical protein
MRIQIISSWDEEREKELRKHHEYYSIGRTLQLLYVEMEYAEKTSRIFWIIQHHIKCDLTDS